MQPQPLFSNGSTTVFWFSLFLRLFSGCVAWVLRVGVCRKWASWATLAKRYNSYVSFFFVGPVFRFIFLGTHSVFSIVSSPLVQRCDFYVLGARSRHLDARVGRMLLCLLSYISQTQATSFASSTPVRTVDDPSRASKIVTSGLVWMLGSKKLATQAPVQQHITPRMLQPPHRGEWW